MCIMQYRPMKEANRRQNLEGTLNH